jgi:hypothetical protein
MRKKIEATVCTCGLNTIDRLTGNQTTFSVFDYAETQEKLQSDILAVMKSSKVIRLHRCFGCEKSFSTKKMSNVLVICKGCYSSAMAENKGKIARNNFIEKTLNNFRNF